MGIRVRTKHIKSVKHEPTGDGIKQILKHVNNPTTSIPGLGTGNLVLSKSPFQQAPATIVHGGALLNGMNKLKLNIGGVSINKKSKNVKLLSK